MTNRFKRILRALLLMSVISAAILYPLFMMGELQGENSQYYQSLFEHYHNSSYEDQSLIALSVATSSFLLIGAIFVMLTHSAMKIAFGDLFQVVVTENSKRPEKKLSPIVEALILLAGSALYFGVSWWLFFSLSSSTQDSAKSWKAKSGHSGRVSELSQKMSENLHDLSHIYVWGSILTLAAGLLLLSYFFISIVRSKKLRKNMNMVEASQEGVEPAADGVKKL
ncbi:hypothetical protein MK805_14310 [Shimazuella sp. AN120528]|uniref:hypothetical protein n=1 Tax=Shimazuella soli TaxID=1892854 RepID=UPI001F0F7E26|nr:hypothetical protein [Shimazuella soli]MCH5586111.1 hypothetical protein [Shimazuella soli]